jgi:hypothetical protein
MQLRVVGVIRGAGDVRVSHHGKNYGKPLFHRGHPEEGRAAQDQEQRGLLGPNTVESFVTGGAKFRDGNHFKLPGGQSGPEAGHHLTQAEGVGRAEDRQGGFRPGLAAPRYQSHHEKKEPQKKLSPKKEGPQTDGGKKKHGGEYLQRVEGKASTLGVTDSID